MRCLEGRELLVARGKLFQGLHVVKAQGLDAGGWPAGQRKIDRLSPLADLVVSDIGGDYFSISMVISYSANGISGICELIGRKLVGGSCIGGMKETQEMMEFAAKHGVKADIEVIPVDYVNTAMQRVPEIGRQLPTRHRHRQHSES
ncbi:hypothetical protein Nepgr_027124 [Nepenthes gracilis]|uniref:Alcohol dehydrogenase-like C-terminal domain-containing protein n=1 Tax=Nepenthes gracilis TaxID=150966 RepID=A0AAD3TAV6_NEPGR|nr:hypothetical protein Nepgr_027124 [Nepenthes gracilis]